jgi:hypothetical protein
MWCFRAKKNLAAILDLIKMCSISTHLHFWGTFTEYLRQMNFRLFLSLFLLSFVFQTSQLSAINCNAFFHGSYSPLAQIENDTVFYIFSMANAVEVHKTKKTRKNYKIRWYSPCEFSLIDDSPKEVGNLSIFGESRISASENKNSVFTLKANDVELILKPTQENVFRVAQDIWESKKEPLKSYDELKKEMEGFSRDSIKSLMKTYFSKKLESKESIYDVLKEDSFELQAILKFYIALRDYDAVVFDEMASTKLQEIISLDEMYNFCYLMESIYGKWEHFEVTTQSFSGGLFSFTLNAPKTISWKFNVKFEKFEEPVVLTLNLSEENNTEIPIDSIEGAQNVIEGPKTLNGFNIGYTEYAESQFLSSISAPFFEDYNKKKYKKIYKNSSKVLTESATKSQVVDMLKLSESMSEGEPFKLYQYKYLSKEDFGGLLVLHYVAETNSQMVYLSLTYTNVPQNRELVGLNISQKKK